MLCDEVIMSLFKTLAKKANWDYEPDKYDTIPDKDSWKILHMRLKDQNYATCRVLINLGSSFHREPSTMSENVLLNTICKICTHYGVSLEFK